MSDLGNLDVVIHGLNIAALGGGILALLRIVVPSSLSIRDSLRDTAAMLNSLNTRANDHEERLRIVERYVGPERRRNEGV